MQIVGYDQAVNKERSPALLLADDEGVDRQPLDSGTELTLSLGDRRCAGAIDGQTHYACSNESAPHCDVHTNTWVCARCTGTCLKDEMDCYEEHAVYLAGIAPDILKVGVTRSWRLDTRLREQGADRYAHLRTVANGRIAREIEAELAVTYTDRVRVPTKISGLGHNLNEKLWDTAVTELSPTATGTLDYGLSLDRQPVHETLASGTVRGLKGRILVLDVEGTTYATDLRSLVGYEVKKETTERSLQSSLGSF